MLRSLIIVTEFLALLVSGCGGSEPSSTPQARRAISQEAKADLEARIHRVENGLILMSEEGEILGGRTGTMAERMAHYGVPGVSVAVIDEFQIAWAEGYGVLEAGGEEAVTATTVFHAGSVAKPVAAAATLALVDRGLLALDESVNGRLLSWRIPDSEYAATEEVTLRRLLSHSAGLSDGWTDGGIECCYAGAGAAPKVTIQQMLDAEPVTGLTTPTRVTTIPGSDYRYSNLGYGILELLLVDVTGQAIESLMQETILGPLGMTSSTFEQPLPDSLRVRATSEHYDRAQPFPDKRHHFPTLAAGGLWTTPSDLARFVIAIMESRAGRSNGVLSRELASEMLKPQVPIPNHPITNAEGLGLGLSGEGESFAFLQTGGTWGSTCILWAYPETGQGAVVMTNARGGQGMIRFEILLAVAREYAWPE
ncbi:MAG: serine hydrolase domain-containing protein [Gemmatimonadales bacterium]